MLEILSEVMGISAITALLVSNFILLKCFQLYSGKNIKEYLSSNKFTGINIKDHLKSNTWVTIRKLKVYCEDPNAEPRLKKLFRLGVITRRIGLWGIITTMIFMMFIPTIKHLFNE